MEDALLQITRREASWGGMLSSTTPAAGPTSAASAQANGSDGSNNGSNGVGAINGRTAAASKAGREGDGLIVGVGTLNGGVGGGDVLPETRTLV